jgi:hypothetical protein
MVALCLLATVGLIGHLQSDRDYEFTGRDNSRIVRSVLARSDRPPPFQVVVGPTFAAHHGVTGMLGPEGQAFSAITGEPGCDVWVALTPQQFDAVRLPHRVVWQSGP